MTRAQRPTTRLAEDGFAILESAVSDGEVAQLLTALEPMAETLAQARRGGLRDVLRRVPRMAELVQHPRVVEVVSAALGPGTFAVRGILFDKHPGANWKVPWHQDLTIAVRERRAVEGYGPWSMKEGLPHVRPPLAVLQQRIAVRVHLDDCGLDNGPIRVIPGSHRLGILAPDAIQALVARHRDVACSVGRGGILAMHPLLLHASAPVRTPRHRRVIHLEFAACELAPELEWLERRPCASEQ